MKTASLIARLLLGIIFLAFGLNGFLHFIPMPPPTGLSAQFFGPIFASGLWVPIFLLQIIPAVLLLINRYVPLALTVLGAVIVNILFFHLFMAPVYRLRYSSRLYGLSSTLASAPRLRVCFNGVSTSTLGRWNLS
jgi:uncharacterized membrane protein YphA (DoxX/SURF4 family)